MQGVWLFIGKCFRKCFTCVASKICECAKKKKKRKLSLVSLHWKGDFTRTLPVAGYWQVAFMVPPWRISLSEGASSSGINRSRYWAVSVLNVIQCFCRPSPFRAREQHWWDLASWAQTGWALMLSHRWDLCSHPAPCSGSLCKMPCKPEYSGFMAPWPVEGFLEMS